ncbi:extracellular solute-binding protein [Oceanobacillus kimchii]|uniref:ABC transporter substrate-binding protein n=1 Tax=Oceanobacillus kimchii TaxID=746691 RepID=UPI0021A466E1|nr:extracellular solute-binding protein [Oceanobacillus kimchii]MCT1578372.1 extracellular solute-binding protein [Oceanobacillus kimchii]MCT2134550.1 extracellular solute-binding protein [Oceanobacillus kimchii]
MQLCFRSFLLVMLAVMILAGCTDEETEVSSKDNEGSGNQVTLTVYSTVSNEAEQNAVKKVVNDFEKENPHIRINLNLPGQDYESQLRIRMAANDLPDLFDTHGWAKNRYGEYTMDLRDMDWVEHLDPTLEQIFIDEKGKVYAYPLNQAMDGLTYNKQILEDYNIEVPETFEEFMQSLETIKEKSDGEIAPFWFDGSTTTSFGQYYDQFATPLLITHPDHDYRDELLNGTFDWEPYTFLSEKLLEMHEKDLLNIDVLTARTYEQNQLIAQGKIAFVMRTVPINVIKELNPDIELGVMPVPAIHQGDSPSWIGGERHTLAIWKDTPHPEEAKAFLDFLSRPENVKAVAEGTSLSAGLTNAKADIYYQPYFDKYKDIVVEPYFDRIYLPNGMWKPMGMSGQELLSGALSPKGVTQKMKSEYLRLFEQAGFD